MSTRMRDYNENTKGNPSSLNDQTMVCINMKHVMAFSKWTGQKLCN